MFARHRIIRLGECLKDQLLSVSGDSGPRVDYAEMKHGMVFSLVLNLNLDYDFAPGSELDCISHKIQHNLFQPGRISQQSIGCIRRNLTTEFEIFLVSLQAQGSDRVFQGIAQIEIDILEFHLARLNFREIQNVIDDGQQGARRNFSPYAGTRAVRE